MHTWGSKRYRAHRIKRRCNRSRRTGAPNPPRQSHNHGAPRTVHPTAGSETNVAGYMTTDWVISRPTKGARAVPAGLNTLDGERRRAHRGKHGCHRSRSTAASNEARRSRDRGASRTPPLTGNSETNVAAWNVTGIENLTQTAHISHGSAETYPHATTVGGGVPDAPSVG